MVSVKPRVTMTGIFSLFLCSGFVLAADGAWLYKERTCIACHGAEGKAPVMTEYPVLAGQNAPYMLAQMKDIKNGVRSHAHTAPMKNVMHLITEEEMAVVAEWLAGIE